MVIAPLAGYLIERVHAGLLGALGLAVMAAGLFALALLPSQPTDLDIIWRMISAVPVLACSSHRTTTPLSPPHRATAVEEPVACLPRACWGSTGAACLVALMFNLAGQNGNHLALLTAGALATLAAIVSGLRVTQPSVQA